MSAAVTDARVSAIESQVREHGEWINGNGQPGAKVRFNTLENNIEQLQKDMGDIKDLLNKAFWTIVVGFGLTIAAGVVSFFLYQVIPHVAANVK